ncbi:hypothetical protein PCASD_05018 [Puccinia coronata f. sp. avenae]|uniref:Uncharacterized protein n=1 Tax=Puccinia coronata f. sp. avenae TaxID=200324 RepID=A0A2N5UNN6_9BASI|nr:hypothetical protein PCASD_17930 [Puccinia coronata f. sp. avenae]PLW39373.1 hypothetical protein PCASD_05018 [Puccinia coronata f. sp. avenae]
MCGTCLFCLGLAARHQPQVLRVTAVVLPCRSRSMDSGPFSAPPLQQPRKEHRPQLHLNLQSPQAMDKLNDAAKKKEIFGYADRVISMFQTLAQKHVEDWNEEHDS